MAVFYLITLLILFGGGAFLVWMTYPIVTPAITRFAEEQGLFPKLASLGLAVWMCGLIWVMSAGAAFYLFYGLVAIRNQPEPSPQQIEASRKQEMQEARAREHRLETAKRECEAKVNRWKHRAGVRDIRGDEVLVDDREWGALWLEDKAECLEVFASCGHGGLLGLDVIDARSGEQLGSWDRLRGYASD